MARPVPDEAVCPCGSEWFRLVDDGLDEEDLEELADLAADPDVDFGGSVGVDALGVAAFGAGSSSGGRAESQAGLVALTGSGSVRAYAGVLVCSECERPWAPGQTHLRLVT